MMSKCPGQDRRFLKIEKISCLACGYIVEIFSDEIKLQCPNCKGLILRDKLLSCVAWCKAARECVGEERWRELKQKG